MGQYRVNRTSVTPIVMIPIHLRPSGTVRLRVDNTKDDNTACVRIAHAGKQGSNSSLQAGLA